MLHYTEEYVSQKKDYFENVAYASMKACHFQWRTLTLTKSNGLKGTLT